MRRHTLCALWVLASASAALADTVSLNNGDKISGTIVELNANAVIVQTPYAGRLTIDRAAVKTMQSEKPVTVPDATAAGATTQKYLSPAPGDKGWVETAAYVPPPPPPPERFTHYLQISPDWKNQISLGVTNAAGNEQSTTVAGEVNFHYTHKPDDLLIKFLGDYGLSNGAQTAGLFAQDTVYKHDLYERLFGYVDDDVRYDALKGISLQATGTGGLGYKLFTGEKFKADVRGGPGVTYLRTFDGDSNTAAAAEAAIHMEYVISDRATATHDTAYTTSLQDFASWRIHSETALNYKLDFERGLGLKLSFADDYENQPSAGRKNNDTRTMLSLTLDF